MALGLIVAGLAAYGGYRLSRPSSEASLGILGLLLAAEAEERIRRKAKREEERIRLAPLEEAQLKPHRELIAALGWEGFAVLHSLITKSDPPLSDIRYTPIPEEIGNGRIFYLIFENLRLSGKEQRELVYRICQKYQQDYSFRPLLAEKPLLSEISKDPALLFSLYSYFKSYRQVRQYALRDVILLRNDSARLPGDCEQEIWKNLINAGFGEKVFKEILSQDYLPDTGVNFLRLWQALCPTAEAAIAGYEKIVNMTNGTKFSLFTPQFNKQAKQHILSIEYAEAQNRESKEEKGREPMKRTPATDFLVKRRPARFGLHFQSKSTSQKIEEKILAGNLAEAKTAIEKNNNKLTEAFESSLRSYQPF